MELYLYGIYMDIYMDTMRISCGELYRCYYGYFSRDAYVDILYGVN